MDFKVVSVVKTLKGTTNKISLPSRKDKPALDYLLHRLNIGKLTEDVALGEGLDPSAVLRSFIVIECC